jgi:hypothetical protein
MQNKILPKITGKGREGIRTELMDSRYYSLESSLMVKFFFFQFTLKRLYLYIYANSRVETHVHIGHPNDGKSRDEVASPIVKKHFETGYAQDDDRNIMTEAIFAGKKIEKFADNKFLAVLAMSYAVLPRLAKNFFADKRPGNGSDRNSEHE